MGVNGSIWFVTFLLKSFLKSLLSSAMFSQLLVAALALPLVLAQQPADVANAFVQTQIVPDGKARITSICSLLPLTALNAVVPSVNFTGLLDVVFTDANSQTADVTPGKNLSVERESRPVHDHS